MDGTYNKVSTPVNEKRHGNQIVPAHVVLNLTRAETPITVISFGACQEALYLQRSCVLQTYDQCNVRKLSIFSRKFNIPRQYETG